MTMGWKPRLRWRRWSRWKHGSSTTGRSLQLPSIPSFAAEDLRRRCFPTAGELAMTAGAKGLCLTVEDTNLSAISVYERLGFAATDRLPWVAYSSRSGPREWVLMKRDF